MAWLIAFIAVASVICAVLFLGPLVADLLFALEGRRWYRISRRKSP